MKLLTLAPIFLLIGIAVFAQSEANAQGGEFTLTINPGATDSNSLNPIEPANITIPVGTTVAWLNKDSAYHQIVSGTPEAGPTNVFYGDFFATNEAYNRTFDSAGVIDYYDPIWTNIRGQVTIVDENNTESGFGTTGNFTNNNFTSNDANTGNGTSLTTDTLQSSTGETFQSNNVSTPNAGNSNQPQTGVVGDNTQLLTTDQQQQQPQPVQQQQPQPVQQQQPQPVQQQQPQPVQQQQPQPVQQQQQQQPLQSSTGETFQSNNVSTPNAGNSNQPQTGVVGDNTQLLTTDQQQQQQQPVQQQQPTQQITQNQLQIPQHGPIDSFKANGKINSYIVTALSPWNATGDWNMVVEDGEMKNFITNMAWFNGTSGHTHDFLNFESSDDIELPADNILTINGEMDVASNGVITWDGVDSTINIGGGGKTITITVDHEDTDHHFAGQPIVGTVTSLTPCSDTPGASMEILPTCD
jgi:plastocyanin